jgi:acyl dehydratase
MVDYFEDIEVGETRTFGEYTLSKEEIIEFAEQYDPQPFHTDEAAAKESKFDGLAASGWHTAAACMRLLADNIGDRAMAGARGVDELRWIKPARPGTTLTVELEVVDKYPADDPEIGNVDNRMTAYDQDGEAVITWVGLAMVERREPLED